METFLRAFLLPSSSDSTTIRGASSKDKGGKEEIDAMVDTGSSSDKEICERDGQAQADHQEGGRAPVMPHQHHGLVQGWQQVTPKRVDEGRDLRSGLNI